MLITVIEISDTAISECNYIKLMSIYVYPAFTHTNVKYP